MPPACVCSGSISLPSQTAMMFYPRVWKHLVDELHLPPRQQQIVLLLLEGCSDKQIASRMGIAIPTVRTHMSRLFGRLKTQDRGSVLVRLMEKTRRLCDSVDCPLR